MNVSPVPPRNPACPEWLIERVRCLFCQSRVEVKSDASGVQCVGCRRVYPIRDGILVLMAEEAVEERQTGQV
jgi:uncharacterized protein